jgi:MFS family permease
MRPNIIQFLANASIMMSAIFIPNFADELGATEAEIGLIGGAYGFAIFFSSYIFGRASDMRDRRSFLTIGLFFSTITFFLQIFARDALSLMVIRALAGFSIGIFTAPLVAYVFEAGGRLGTFSAYGSLGWAIGSVLAGVIAQHGETLTHISRLLPYWEVFFLSSMFFLISLYISLTLPEVVMKRVQVPLFPIDLIRRNAFVYLPAFLRHTGAFSIWIIFPLFLVELGASKFWIGIIYFFNAGTQFLIMRHLDLRNDVVMIKMGLALSAMVFFSYTLAGNFYHVMPIQVLLALSFSFLYVGSLLYLTRTNEEKATSVGILNSVTNIAVAVGPIFGGVVSQAWGFHAVMYFAAALAFLGMIISVGRGED